MPSPLTKKKNFILNLQIYTDKYPESAVNLLLYTVSQSERSDVLDGWIDLFIRYSYLSIYIISMW
jgi:hypothetical protein